MIKLVSVYEDWVDNAPKLSLLSQGCLLRSIQGIEAMEGIG